MSLVILQSARSEHGLTYYSLYYEMKADVSGDEPRLEEGARGGSRAEHAAHPPGHSYPLIKHMDRVCSPYGDPADRLSGALAPGGFIMREGTSAIY